ncbi:MAG TPA: hypothetical protein DDY98_06805 [Ruminococcaceae bacterium]|nr:hypothetical protein [Oscillospiraceae bacterium]
MKRNDVELFDNLPLYKGGNAVDEVFNCGAGLAVETDNATEEDSFLKCVENTTSDEFLRYCKELEASGLILDYSDDNADLLCREYYSEKLRAIVYMYYSVAQQCTRIILDRSSVRYNEFCSSSRKDTQDSTALMQFGLYYSTMIKGDTCDCGMFYAVRLRDNSLLLVDGGEHEQATELAIEEVIRCLRHMTGANEGEKMVISAWFCTHNHDDHMDVFAKLIKFHSDIFDVRRVMFNFPSKTLLDYTNTCTERMKTRLHEYYPNAMYKKLHTGQKFTISNAEFEVVTTHEDILPDAFDEERLYRGMNETTTVLKITFDNQSLLLLGDSEDRNGEAIRRNYANRGLSCTYLQAAHHGINRVENIYSFVKAEKVLMPECRFINERSQKENFAVLCRYNNLENVFFAGDCTRIFTVKDGETSTEYFPIVGYHYDGSEY